MLKPVISAFNIFGVPGKSVAQTSDEKLKMFQAQDPNADPEILDTLADPNEKWDIRAAVAQNRRTYLKTLEKLSEQQNDNFNGDFKMRWALALNPNICASKKILDTLSSDSNMGVVTNLAANSALPSVYLEKLYTNYLGILRTNYNYVWLIFYHIAIHTNTSLNILEKLADEEDSNILWGLAQNTNCSPEIFTKLYEKAMLYKQRQSPQKPSLFIRWALAENRNTPDEILIKLTGDENINIRKAALENLTRRGLKAQALNLAASALPLGSLIAPLYNLFRKKDYEKTRDLPAAKGVIVTQGYYKGAKFNLVSVDPKLNETLVYLAPQKPDGSFQTRKIDFVASKYPGTRAVINGSFFNNSPGGDDQPLGPVIYRNGKYHWTPTARNYEGKPVYSFNRPFFAIDKNGTPVIRQSGGKRAEELLRDDYTALLGGGGPLIQGGKITVSGKTLANADISPQTHQMNSRRQRTCVGIKEDGTILLCTFGHQAGSGASKSGITLSGLAEFMLSKGAKEALFFDGGGSTGLYLSDEQCAGTGIPREQPTYIIITDKSSAKFIEKTEDENEKRLHKKDNKP